jgi:hypothetical protein
VKPILTRLWELVLLKKKIKKTKAGKAKIVQDVMKQGVTYRKATTAVNAVIDAWKRALCCDEPIVVPGGVILTKARHGKPRMRIRKLRNVQTHDEMYRPV